MRSDIVQPPGNTMFGTPVLIVPITIVGVMIDWGLPSSSSATPSASASGKVQPTSLSWS